MSKHIILIISLLSLIFTFFPFAATAKEIDKAQIKNLFFESQRYFKEANKIIDSDFKKAKNLYLKSIVRLERIINDGRIHNGKLFYNLGNIYFRIHNIGKAILNYKRAFLYIPHDINLNQNLTYARQKRIDQIENKEEDKVLKILFFWHYDFSSKLRLTLFIIFFSVIWLFASLKLFFNKIVLKWGIIISLILSSGILSSLTIDFINEINYNEGVIIYKKVVARKGDSKTYEPSFDKPLHAGTEFTLIEDRGDWKYVELNNGKRCWLPGNSIELVRLD